MDKVVLNVSGKKFVTFWKTLKKFPDTRLGRLSKTSKHYDSACDEFFFDRNPKVMTVVLDMYREGELHFPVNVCSACVKQELQFWDIPEDFISECCWKRYSIGNEDKAIVDIIESFMSVVPEFTDKDHDTWRKRISNTLEYPTYSSVAMAWNAAKMTMVVVITLTVMLGTVQSLRVGLPELTKNNQTIKKLDIILTTDTALWINYTEIVCLAFFSLDMIARFLTSPSKKTFVRDWLNIIDFLLDLIMWLAFLLEYGGNLLGHTEDLRLTDHVLKALFVLNVLRLLHFVRQYAMMKILLLTFRASFGQLLLLCVGLTIAVVIFATVIYFVEIGMGVDTFDNIPIAIWWAVVTMTTVGYGDYHPHSPPGYIVGILCSLSGILLLAMPVAIIASNFTAYHMNLAARNQRIRRHKILRKRAGTNKGFLPPDHTQLEDFDESDFKMKGPAMQNGISHNQVHPIGEKHTKL
ncbi:potassium voltage-gated channel protein Shaw-like [Haliotis rufescens]|uniref:potassium voltage-gated channel protein Shaw-like n=1 Tax=Haliotis rufescens TaxID=6454 RepID=UPI001EB024E1|nr:potassium voltage-gated channel protein Shaw-like [Haliotis rufescens]